jgi:hypothetical protein
MSDFSIAELEKNLEDHKKNLDLHKTEVLAVFAEFSDLRAEFTERFNAAENKLKKLLGEVGLGYENSKSLREFIKESLLNSNEPLTAKEISDMVQEAGYKSTSKNFQSIVLLCLTKNREFKKATRAKTRPIRFDLVSR